MGHSRITLATLLALGLLGTVQAEERAREPFFVELKGPDGSPPPAVQPEPRAQPVAPVTLPRAQPIVRQVPAASAGSYGPVRPTDTLWSLASKHRPSNRVSVYQTMVAIYDKNPRSFADGNINHILVGSHILLPTAAEAGRITDAEARRPTRRRRVLEDALAPEAGGSVVADRRRRHVLGRAARDHRHQPLHIAGGEEHDARRRIAFRHHRRQHAAQRRRLALRQGSALRHCHLSAIPSAAGSTARRSPCPVAS